jgi:hypothetical protein
LTEQNFFAVLKTVMKKRTAPKRPARKTVKRTIPHSRASSRNQTVFFRRIVIISACLVMVIGVFATFNRGTASQAVAGASIARGLFMQATVELPSVPNASGYNIYYKQQSDQKFTNAVRNIPTSVQQYTISYLKKGVTYEYTEAAIVDGKEVDFSPIQTLTNLQSM